MSRRDLLNSHQKLSLGVVIVIGITTLVFGLFQMRRAIFEPMELDGRVSFKTVKELELEYTEQLKTQDTDGDGLSDYDELYLFRTSPFLVDSDSDGISDYDEVMNMTDPNCPKGTVCTMTRSADQEGGSGTQTIGLSASQEKMAEAMERVFGDLDEFTPEIMMERLSTLPPAELRQFMLDIGTPPELLEQANDAMLRQIFQDTMGDMVENESSADPLEDITR
jgi:hypothetical protein